jgi:hypothetical protein
MAFGQWFDGGSTVVHAEPWPAVKENHEIGAAAQLAIEEAHTIGSCQITLLDSRLGSLRLGPGRREHRQRKQDNP